MNRSLLIVFALVPALAAPSSCQPIPTPEPPGPVASGGFIGTGGTGSGGLVNPFGGTPAAGGMAVTGGWPDPGTGGHQQATGGAPGGGGGTPEPTDAELACSRLLAVGCPEGKRSTCVAEIQQIEASQGRASIDLDCLILSSTVAQVRACKSVACEGAK